MGHGVDAGGTFRRVPHVLLTVEEIEGAVALYKDCPNFVFDVETTSVAPHQAELRWIGIGAAGMVHLIPCGHPLGEVLSPRHKAKTAAYFFYGADDPQSYTPATRSLPLEQRKPSFRMIEHWEDAVYAPAPPQLYPHEVLDLLRPLMFSDKGKIGHNVKYRPPGHRQVLRRASSRPVSRHDHPHPRSGRGPDELRPQDVDR